MNKKGFTLVEILVVVVLLGLLLGIAIPGVVKTGKRAKQKTLVAKIETIEKAAILYAQEEVLSYKKISSSDDVTLYSLCFKNGNLIKNCYYAESLVTVSKLANPDNNDATDDGYIKYDDEENKEIINPSNNKNINDCTVTIYRKYGKIYASYNNKIRGNDCWVEE